MNDRRLVFVAPGRVEVEAFDAGRPGPGQVELLSEVSAISAGTESLLWRGLWPGDLGLDGLWSPEPGTARYPLSYGYAVVGRVGEVGKGVDATWSGRRAFSFAPHQSRSLVDTARLVRLPDTLDAEDGVFLAAMETALTLVQDAAPVVGEIVGVLGLGTIGALAATLLNGPFEVRAWDREAFRRERAATFGAAVAPLGAECDVVLELTGRSEGLSQALASTRFSGRVVAGSWYGAQPLSLDLGGAFHRSRIQLLSSQVSTVSPSLSGRWTKERRLEAALALTARLKPSNLVTHRFPLEAGTEAYTQACDRPQDGLQVLFTY